MSKLWRTALTSILVLGFVGCGGEAMPKAFSPQLSAVCYSCQEQVNAALSAIGSLPEAGMHVIAPVTMRPGDSVKRLG